MDKVYCPKCGKRLIRLEPFEADNLYEFWIIDNKLKKEND